jgi:hypothetical protein
MRVFALPKVGERALEEWAALVSTHRPSTRPPVPGLDAACVRADVQSSVSCSYSSARVALSPSLLSPYTRANPLSCDRIHMFDVGGQRSERKKWIHCFERWASYLFFLLPTSVFVSRGRLFPHFYSCDPTCISFRGDPVDAGAGCRSRSEVCGGRRVYDGQEHDATALLTRWRIYVVLGCCSRSGEAKGGRGHHNTFSMTRPVRRVLAAA